MTITFYNTPSEPIKLDKELNSASAKTGSLRNQSSVINPIIMVETPSMIGYNYAYIPEFNRYYFINDAVIVKNNLWEVSMHVDVLMSNRVQLQRLSAVIARNEKEYNLYLDDPMFKVYNYPVVQTVPFPNSFTANSELVLVVAGGEII